MKIDITEFAKCAEKNYKFDVYVALKIVEDGSNYLFPNNYFTETYNNLKASGYIYSETQLTPKGKELLKEISGERVSKKVNNDFYQQLHKKLQTELITLTGKKQKMINGKYPFLCNSTDLEYKLSKVIKKYKLEDKNKIEKLLLRYVYNCHKANFEMTAIVEYYIDKNNFSKLATDYENFSEKEEVKKEELKNTKDLF